MSCIQNETIASIDRTKINYQTQQIYQATRIMHDDQETMFKDQLSHRWHQKDNESIVKNQTTRSTGH